MRIHGVPQKSNLGWYFYFAFVSALTVFFIVAPIVVAWHFIAKYW